MDFATILMYFLAIVETGALIFALIYATKALKEKKDALARKGHYQKAGLFFAVYIVLNCLRLYVFKV